MKDKEEIRKAIRIHKESNRNPCKNKERLRALYWVLEEHEKEESLEPIECSNPLFKYEELKDDVDYEDEYKVNEDEG